ncbi:hypothetical protein Enr13x_11600 [Stieleria neptunia]|uniref:Uncharacterized protein n=1 Tax=Stieleria neptunia TaxID=2527979 RepID=A0A518HKD5_9BACT|nr:serine protease [Stieleria neptunia]QDV41322.1 hypothetical protein Enr13x_11600 [Stieleria neptunia]
MKILIASVCLVLVVVQLGYLTLIDIDGQLDESQLPAWMADETAAVNEVATHTGEISGDAHDGDGTRQSQGEPSAGAMTAERIETLGRATAVRILDANQQFVGSGVVVAKREGSFDVVTAYHVIEKPGRYGIESFRTSSVVGTTLRHAPSAVTILRSDPDVDLAYLRVSALIQPAQCVSVTSAAPVESILSEAWIVDCTGSGAAVVSKIDNVTRQTARRSQDGVGVSYWRLGQESSPGMSGSALLDAEGRLIGVASGNSDGSAYYCEVDALHEFVDGGRVQDDAPLGGGVDVPDAVD